MESSYDIAIEPQHNLLRITIGNLFGAGDVVRFERDRSRAMALLDGASAGHVTLCDMRFSNLRRQDILAAFRPLIDDAQYRSRKLAIVLEDSVAGDAQTSRRFPRRGVAMFDNASAAKAWLLEA